MSSVNDLVKSTEAEQSVLGSILLDATAIREIEPILTEDMFYHEEHKIIFDSMKKIYKRNEPIDLITLTEEVKHKGHLNRVGGISYITSLSNVVPSLSNALYHANIVLDKYKNRNIIDKFNKFKLGEIDDNTLIYQLEQDINKIDKN